MLTVPPMAVEEDEVVGALTVHALDHPVEQAHGGTRTAFAERIQLAHLYTARVCRPVA